MLPGVTLLEPTTAATPPDERRPAEAPLARTVVHVVTNLELGGAQRMLVKLLEAGVSRPATTHVVVLMPGGPLTAAAIAAGVSVHALGLGRGAISPLAAWRLARLLGRLQPDLVQGWMYHGNLAASLAMAGGGVRNAVDARPALLWNIRGALDDPARERWLTRLVVRLGAALSGRPDAILYNSQVAARQHEAVGYRAGRRHVVANGFDIRRFAPDPTAGRALRERLGITGTGHLVGIAAEWRPMKDHPNLLRAVGRLVAAGVDLDLVLVGAGTEADSPHLLREVAAHGLGGRVHGLGAQLDPAPLIRGFDIAVLASAWGEGFPNFIGEAMACGIPCVATDSGDCRSVIGDTGAVVPPRDPAALAAALAGLLRLPAAERAALGRRARERIVEHFTMPAIAGAYRDLYTACIQGEGAARRADGR